MTIRSEIDDIALAAIRKELPGLRAALQRQLSGRIASRITHVIENKREAHSAFLRDLKRREREVAHREARVDARVTATIKQLQELHHGKAQ